MTRKYIDCREVPSTNNCSVAISADTEDELVEAAVQHAVTVHQHADGPELRTHIRDAIRDGTPPLDYVPGAGQGAERAAGNGMQGWP